MEKNHQFNSSLSPPQEIINLLNPMYLFEQETKDKSYKKAAIAEVSTIALVLGQKKTRQQLIPFLIKLFIQENTQIRLTILKVLPNLLNYIGNSDKGFIVLQFILDILCAMSEEQIRQQAYICLQKTITFIDVRKHQNEIIRILNLLNQQEDKNIKELVIRLIPYAYIVADSQNQLLLLQILKSYQQSAQGQLMLASHLCELIRIMPPAPEIEIRNFIEQLLLSQNAELRSCLIQPVILLTRVLSEQSTAKYYLQLIEDNSSIVFCSIIHKISDIIDVFSEELVQKLLCKIDKINEHSNEVKNVILQMLQFIPLSSERRKLLIFTDVQKSLNQKNILTKSLCKMHDIEGLTNLINNSDNEFKIKLFPKLPQTCEIHAELFEIICTHKNWRGKLQIIQNLQKRLENEQNVEILIPKLFNQLGDRIATVRMSTSNLISLIIEKRKINLIEIEKLFQKSIGSTNWFERQSVLLLIQKIIEFNGAGRCENEILFLKRMIKSLDRQRIQNIGQIINRIQTKLSKYNS